MKEAANLNQWNRKEGKGRRDVVDVVVVVVVVVVVDVVDVVDVVVAAGGNAGGRREEMVSAGHGVDLLTVHILGSFPGSTAPASPAGRKTRDACSLSLE